ncbi:MAG: alpha/beta hydrolase, partial [Clostridia bacterium]
MALNFKSYLKHFNRNRDINKVDAHSRSRQSVLYETILFNAKALRTMTGNTKLLLAGRAIDNKKSFKLSDNLYKKLNAKERLVNGFPVYDFESINFEGKGRYVLYLHGGTYAYQPTVLHWLFLERIVAEIPTHITMPIYPKAPTHTYKEAIDMICKVYEQLLSVTTADNIVVMGDSAGGGLTLALCEYLRENHYSQPLKTILLCPWVDVRCNNERIVDYVAKDPLLIRAELITLGSAYAGDKATDYY